MASILVLHHRASLNPRMELIAESLAANGYDVEAVCWDRTGTANESGNAVPTTRLGEYGFDVSLLNVFFLPLVYLEFALAIHRRDCDLLVCSHISLLPIAVLVGTLSRTPVVYDVVEFYLEGYGDRDGRFTQHVSTLISTVEHACLRLVDGITVIDTYKDTLRRRYEGHTPNIRTVYNLPHLKPVSEDRTDSDGQSIVYAGLVNERKGVRKLLEAFVRVKDQFESTTLIIVGDSVDDTVADLRRFAREEGVADAVQFTGRVEYGQVHDIICEGDIAAAPYQPVRMFELSRWNARKIPDYMNAGLPVVAPDFGGFPEIIEETGCGITVDTADPDAIADGLEELLSNPEYARALGEQGRQAAERRYNWESEERKVLDVVESALS